MDVPTMLRRIKRQFGDEYDVVITSDDIYGWIYEAELDIIRNAPDSCIFNQNVPNPTSGLGGDFPLPIPVVVTIQRVVWNGEPLQYITKEEADETGLSLVPVAGAQYAPIFWYVGPQNIGASSGSSGTPGRSLFLLPLPPYSQSGSVLVSYTKTPVLLTGVGSESLTVPEVYHTDVVTFCLARAHNKNQNAQSEKMQMDLYDKALTLRRDEANTVDVNTYKGLDSLDYECYDAWL